ncbi:hypothetical protein [Micromonospora sp. WMMD1082]|uniref:hypothetical protein n=1 Tax=Micromonospora sp. WMMD1082 TaxID=3016104 RepID=UPI0024161E02|nr:hypothetical protein [Micromonospora sp. WMMD1082]MDG4795452.1 hypothetical protein [Micromonospora sp. WMMD1082]
MSARDRSRLAALPGAGYRPTPRLADEQRPQVTFSPETRDKTRGPARVFDFSALPVSTELQLAFARAFAFRTRAGGSIRATGSANQSFRIMRSFAVHLAAGNRPPQTPADLAPAHVKGWAMARRDHAALTGELAVLKACLRRVPGITAEFTACLSEPPRRPSPKTSYSRTEMVRTLDAARGDVRRAAERIQAGRALLQRWRAGDLDGDPGGGAEKVRRRGRLLDCIDRDGDVPRSGARGFAVSWVRALGSLEAHFAMLYLTSTDIAAFVVLLVGLTGQNRSTIINAPAGHHRADGYAGGPATAVVELDKPRRGRHRHMDVALVDVPLWAPAPSQPHANSDSDVGAGLPMDLRTPFGVYMLLHDLAGPARQRMGSDKLIAWWSARIGGTAGGFRDGLTAHQVADWARLHDLRADPLTGGGPAPALGLTLRRLRLTFNELQQRPVAHTERTLANEYLARNRGNLAEYQQVVAAALDQEAAKAKTLGKIRILSAADVIEARDQPARVAARYGMEPATLQRLLAGQLDTVLGGCVDNTSGPHDPGTPCRASFMLCLSCPCARAMPHHLPVQVLVHDELAARRRAMTPLRWAHRFALAHTQLVDLLDRAGAVAVADARAAITDAERALVDRFLGRELDLR